MLTPMPISALFDYHRYCARRAWHAMSLPKDADEVDIIYQLSLFKMSLMMIPPYIAFI